jgi:hypothetical protein
MKKNNKPIKLVTIKVTETAARNFNIVAALTGKLQYQVSEEASQVAMNKHLKTKTKQ